MGQRSVLSQNQDVRSASDQLVAHISQNDRVLQPQWGCPCRLVVVDRFSAAASATEWHLSRPGCSAAVPHMIMVRNVPATFGRSAVLSSKFIGSKWHQQWTMGPSWLFVCVSKAALWQAVDLFIIMCGLCLLQWNAASAQPWECDHQVTNTLHLITCTAHVQHRRMLGVGVGALVCQVLI